MIVRLIVVLFVLSLAASAAPLVTNGFFTTDCSGWATVNTDGSFCQTGVGGLGAGNPGGWASLNNGCCPQVSMSQTISGLVVGTTYQLSWDMQSAFKCCGSNSIPGAGAQIDGNTYEFIILNNMGWTSFSRTFTYTGTSNVLTMSAQRNGTDSDAGFDNIVLTPLASGAPEPSTLALIGAGLATVFFGRRRRP